MQVLFKFLPKTMTQDLQPLNIRQTLLVLLSTTTLQQKAQLSLK